MKKILGYVLASAFAIVSSYSVAQSAPPNDAQIAAIVVAANTVDINGGKLAKTKATDKEVKAFAQRMVTDHTGVNKEATALVGKLHVKPQESDTSKSLKDEGAKTLAHLKTLKGAAFDKAYIDNEVTYHEQVLDAIDKTLLPNAKNEQLKTLLTKYRPVFEEHLEHAKQIQSAMK